MSESATWTSSGRGLCPACHGEIRGGDRLTYSGDDVVHVSCSPPPPISPECRDRFKHAACAGLALDEASDGIVDCACGCHTTLDGRATK